MNSTFCRMLSESIKSLFVGIISSKSKGTRLIFPSLLEALPITRCLNLTTMKWTPSKYAPSLSVGRLLLTAHIALTRTTTYRGSPRWRVQAFISHCDDRLSDKAWICVARKRAKLRRGRGKMPQEVWCIWARDVGISSSITL